jgi:type IV secretion system protein VirB5
MLDTLSLPPTDKDLAAGKRQFTELYGSLAVMNTYLKIAVVALCGVCLALVALNWRTVSTLGTPKPPLVIRINDVGRAEAVKYSALEYHPQEAELKYFLADFVERHYGRLRATWRESYARSLYFLDGRLADSLIESNKKARVAEGVLLGTDDEIEVTVKSVALEDLRTSPYRATVDFEKAYFAPDHSVRKREKYIANFVFVIREQVPNALIPVNPLGLTITYFREDQAFR